MAAESRFRGRYLSRSHAWGGAAGQVQLFRLGFRPRQSDQLRAEWKLR